MNYRNFILVFMLFFSCRFLYAEGYKETRTISKSIKTEKDTRINITNKYGTIRVNTWEKDSVRFEIELTISGTNKSKVEKAGKNINFRFSGNETNFYVETEFGNDFNTFWNDIKKRSNIMNSGVRINYNIYAPDYIGISIDHKFGEVFLDDFREYFRLKLSNGALNAEILPADSHLNLNFSDAIIGEFPNGEIILSYSELNINKCLNLTLESRSSTIHIKEAETLNLDTRRDKIFLSNVNVMKGESYFSKLSISSIGKEINFNVKYGMLNIDVITQELKRLELDLKFTDVSLYVPKRFSCNMDINIGKTVFKYPAEYDKLDIKATTDDLKSFHIKGNTGSVPAKTQFKITSLKGSLDILYRKEN